jgi:hypothetical protein
MPLKSAGIVANRPSAPLIGDEYTSTDEKKKYTCFVAGAWIEDQDTGFPVDYSD